MIHVACSKCGIRILVPTTVQGRTGVCFSCGAPLTVPSAPGLSKHLDLNFAPGASISGRYTIQEMLGKGGMGVVYRAYDGLVKEDVALKFMRPQLLRTQQGQMDFIQEAQVARRLRHENIVAVHDVSWTNEGILYLTMELLRGQSLREILRRKRLDRKFLDVRLAVSFTSQVLAALEHAHRTVMHRDLKPENVMVLPGEHVKVLDFGLARALDAEPPAPPSVSQAGTRITGTWAYAAPEQKRRQAVDARADLYAVGLLLYELLTLRTPLDEYLPAEQTREDIAPSLVAVLERALAPEREQRWQTAHEFRANLLEAFDQSYRRVYTPAQAPSSEQPVSVEDMVFLEGGSFLMGNNGAPEEAPEFEATVKAFYMDQYPVTVAQYAAFAEATGHRAPKFSHDAQLSGPTQPVVGVSWHDAAAYAAWAGKQLPTETQWEYAARGKGNRKYPWGNADPDPNRCNFGDFLGMPSIVTMHKDGWTPDGVCDLAGNVYEWTRDPYVPYAQRLANPEAGPATPLMAIRGGSWSTGPDTMRCTHRRGLFPEAQLTTVGFRCVVAARRRRPS